MSTTEFQARAVEHIGNLAHIQVSATAVHRWAQDQGTEITFDVAQADGESVVLDATKVCAGDKERGAALNLGLSIRKRYWSNGRPRLELYPVCFGVDESWSETGQTLQQVKPDRVVFDGDEAIVGWVESALPQAHKQRGVWHLVRQLYWPLWKDGLSRSQAEPWMRHLGKLMYHPEFDVQDSQNKLKNLVHQLSEKGLHHGAAYLAAAAPYVFTYREHPDGMFFDDRRFEPLAISSTSPAERQMREINRRTDVGAWLQGLKC